MSEKTRIVFDGNCTERSFPRTLTEAIGNAYAQGPVEGLPEPMSPTDRIVVIGCVIAVLALVCLIAWGQVQ
jgi:hypothetical protein